MPLDTSARPSTRVNGDRPGSRTRRWLAVGLAVVAATAAMVGLYRYVNHPGGGAAGRPASLTTQLADQLAAQLERSTPAEHASHGHDLGSDPGRLLCTVEIYGADPPTATRPAQVTKAYGYHLCAIGSKAYGWDLAPKLVGPIEVNYATQPPTVQVVEGGEGYPDRVRQLIPERFQKQALHGFTNGQTVADLRQRYETVIPRS